MRRSPVTSAVMFATGVVTSLHIRNYRQRCEAFWMARNGIPAHEIQQRLNLTYLLRIGWGYWYMCIYFPFVLGGIVTGAGFMGNGVLQAVGLQAPTCDAISGECHRGPIFWPAVGLTVSLVLAVLTWWALARINGVISRGIPGYGDRSWPRVPSWDAMGEGMPAEWHDPATRAFIGFVAIALMVGPHLLLGISAVLAVLEMLRSLG